MWSQSWPTGSEYTNGAGEDVDLVVFTEDPEAQRGVYLAIGFVECGADYGLEGDNFKAFRQGRLNIIMVWDYQQYIRWVAFSEVARRLGSLDKCHRIELSKAVVEGDAQAACNIVRTTEFNQLAGELAAEQLAKLY